MGEQQVEEQQIEAQVEGQQAVEFPSTMPADHPGFNAVLRKRCGKSILDSGCGKGRWVEWALKHHRGYYGIDIDAACIKKCSTDFPMMRFRVGDSRKIPFKPDSFDTVLLVEVIEHLVNEKDVYRALHEACRVAKKCVAMTTPDCTDAEELRKRTNGITFMHLLETGKGRKFASREARAHAHWTFHTVSSLGDILKELGHPFEIYRTGRVECVNFPCYRKLEVFIDPSKRV